MPTILNQVLLAFLFVTVGFIGGALVSLVLVERGNREKKNEDVPAAQPEPRREPENVQVPAARGEGLLNEAGLWRKPDTGRLVAEIDGVLYTEAETLSAPQRQKMVRLVKEWVAWMGIAPEVKPQPQPAVRQPEQRMEEMPGVQASKAHPAPPGQSVPAKSTASVDLPVEPVRAAPASIVGQIDDILQEMLATAGLKPKSIRLTEDATDGVVVWVGNERFVGTEGVPNAAVRSILKAAAAEWERRAESDLSHKTT